MPLQITLVDPAIEKRQGATDMFMHEPQLEADSLTAWLGI